MASEFTEQIGVFVFKLSSSLLITRSAQSGGNQSRYTVMSVLSVISIILDAKEVVTIDELPFFYSRTRGFTGLATFLSQLRRAIHS